MTSAIQSKWQGGHKSRVQIQGDVKAQVNSLFQKLLEMGGGVTGTFTEDEFEGITQEATDTAVLQAAPCRERIFNRMFDRLSSAAPVPPTVLTSEGSESAVIQVGPQAAQMRVRLKAKSVANASNVATMALRVYINDDSPCGYATAVRSPPSPPLFEAVVSCVENLPMGTAIRFEAMVSASGIMSKSVNLEATIEPAG
jgi:hypothetical protein